MSKTLSVFVGDGPSIEECRTVIQEHLRIQLTQRTDRDGQQFEGQLSGVCVALFNNHGLVDDCAIEFTQFPLEIDFTRYAGTNGLDLNETSVPESAVSLAESLSKKFGARCIVVDNLQRTVHSFEPSSERGTFNVPSD